ncbi:MAG: hypothetical protein J1E43_02745 [Christensenellaceae bacterium]|nr:hypothetical protein [Christensenellaceae bacterium]
MTDHELALRYAPIIHFDRNETIPLLAAGYTIFRETKKSWSFPKRSVPVPPEADFVIEYAYFWDYDIGHMYDLEHIWVTVDKQGKLIAAESSFHGWYLTLLVPELSGTIPPTDEHVHAFCQPGKHAFLPIGEFYRIMPYWYECCNKYSGGPVLIGNPFSKTYTADGKDVFSPTPEDDERCARYLREHKAFEPTLDFSQPMPEDVKYMPWEEMFKWIPERVNAECARLKKLYEGA